MCCYDLAKNFRADLLDRFTVNVDDGVCSFVVCGTALRHQFIYSRVERGIATSLCSLQCSVRISCQEWPVGSV